MSDCANCSQQGGCTTRKSAMCEEVDRALRRLYPGQTWGELDDDAQFGGGISADEGRELGRTLAAILKASVVFRPGGDDELCDYLYVLCVGREPSLVQVRDDGIDLPEDLGLESARETYLRVALSSIVRFAAVQEVWVEFAPDCHGDVSAPSGGVSAEYSDMPESGGDALAENSNMPEPGGGVSVPDGEPIVAGGGVITESPRLGVYDPALLRRFRALVSALGEHDIVHLDFGEIVAPPTGFFPGRYGELYGLVPSIANYLFFPQPAETITSVWIES